MAAFSEPAPWASTYGADNRTDLPAPFTGAPNVGGYEMAAAAGMVELAYGLLVAAHVDPAVATETAADLGLLLLDRADQLQVRLRKRSMWVHAHAVLDDADGTDVRRRLDEMDLVDRSGSSHVRARGALRTVAETLGPPTGDVEAWLATLDERAYAILRSAHDLAYCAWPDTADAVERVAKRLTDVPTAA